MVKTSSATLRVVFYVGPLLAWMLLLFSLSTDVASAERTRPAVGGLASRLLPWLEGRLTPAQLDGLDNTLRKGFHVGAYAVLGLLAYRAAAFGDPRFRRRHVALSFLIGALYAVSDEYHQSFYPSRGASARDVLFDTIGVSLGLLCLWFRAAHRSRAPIPERSPAS